MINLGPIGTPGPTGATGAVGPPGIGHLTFESHNTVAQDVALQHLCQIIRELDLSVVDIEQVTHDIEQQCAVERRNF